ncbi:unannotated protein [freshwater metagenome]|uniref:Unannotated protein n=1 Tax=freshwater metagenome TaxID=449393 RepID=A0A6J7C8G2_9ZZZZ
MTPYEPLAMSSIVSPRGPGVGLKPHSLLAPRSHFQSSGKPRGDSVGSPSYSPVIGFSVIVIVFPFTTQWSPQPRW